ncbi:MAG: S9 family peptidase, partial [Chloroflexi bacterium]|nr:S9 family peptidase [Chloroflexota bacterium]
MLRLLLSASFASARLLWARTGRPSRTIVVGVACVAACTAYTAGLHAQPPALTVDRIVSQPSLTGTAPSSPVWSPDAGRLAFLWNDRAKPNRDVWVVPAAGGQAVRVTDLERDLPRTTPPGSGLEAAPTQASPAPSVSDLIWTPDGRGLVFMCRGDLYEVGADGQGLKRLTRMGPARYAFPSDPDVPPPQGTVLAFSPDGNFISFIRDGDLWWYVRRAGLVAQVTRMALPPAGIIPGGRFSQPDVGIGTYRWSPDTRYVALYHDDRTRVRKVLIPNYLTEETTVNAVRRGYPGEDDQAREVSILSVEQGRIVRKVALEDSTGRRFTDLSWSPDGKHLLVDQYSPDALHRWISIANPDNGSVRELWRDPTPSRRVTQFWNAEWHSDGQGIVFVSDFEGWHRLYSIPLAGGPAEPLTQGDWDIIGAGGRATVQVVPATRQVFFVSTQKNPYERQVYRVAETGGPITQVTTLPGTHDPLVSPDGAKVALLHTDDVTPRDLYIVDAKGGSPERRITNSPPPEFHQYKWIQPRYVTFKSRIDGFTLHGRLIEPPNLDPTKKYPAILGPVYLDTVRNQWGGTNSSLQQYLALEGQYLILQVDSRGSAGYGRKFREALAGRYGFDDVQDLRSGAEYLATLPSVDPARIGIWGSSYGGMLTVLALFQHPGVWKAGVAGAPCVYLPHFLTHDLRRIGTPQLHPDWFRDSS